MAPEVVERQFSLRLFCWFHHHKFMVIDGKHVETGSFNYSAGAVNKNAENVLPLRDVPELAAQYAKEWQRLWGEGEDAKPKY